MNECSNCKHSRPTLTDDSEPNLKCMRYPPQIFIWEGDLHQGWPDAIMVCGEFEKEV